MIGKIISHYKILGKLGEGGMGVVYKAEDLTLKREVALKFLPPHLTQDPVIKKRFIQEARAASSLDHPNICTIHEIGETADGQTYLVMACYEGETLQEKIARGPLAISLTLDLILQIAQGLAKAHEKGIIHRDIKPTNLFITTDGVVKIIDFGLAKLAESTLVTREGATLGTTAYMSPEQVSGSHIDQRTDIWSLGVILYEMLTGRLPFRGDYDQAIMYSIMNQDPEPLDHLRPDIDDELNKIVSKTLQKNTSERYQKIDDLLSDLRSIKISAENKVSEKVKKERWSTYIIPGTSLLVIIWAILLFFSTNQKKFHDRSNFIAVLPFTCFSGSDEDKEFAVGIHDDILTKLSKIKGLRVIARTSVLRYRDTAKSIGEIAKELNVRNILEGSTRRNGDIIRVSAQLIDAETEEHIWAEIYDRQYGDIFSIQSDVAQKIASALQIKLMGKELQAIEKAPTNNLLAYEYFKKGQHFWNTYFDYEGNRKAAEMFEQACLLDSTFGEAWGWQSVAYSIALYYASDISVLDELKKKAVVALRKAESIAPELNVTSRARAEYLQIVQNRRAEAVKQFEALLEKNPNDAETLYRLSILNRGAKALVYAKKCFELDPKGIQAPRAASTTTFWMGDYEESEKWADIMISNNPENGRSYANKLQPVLVGKGDLERAEIIIKEAHKFAVRDLSNLEFMEFIFYLYKRDYQKAWSLSEHSNVSRGTLAYLTGKRDDAKIYFDSGRVQLEGILQKKASNEGDNMSLALCYAGTGSRKKANEIISKMDMDIFRFPEIRVFIHILLNDYKSALSTLEELNKRGMLTKSMLTYDPRFDAIRDRVEFKSILNKMKK